MTNKKIISVVFIVVISHFLLTSLIGHYIAVQVGSQVGKIVAEGLIDASETKSDNTEAEAKRSVQDMKAKSEAIKDKWKLPELIISLPAKPLITPLLRELGQKQMYKVINKEISRDQFRTEVLITVYAVRLLNSLCLGLLLYITLKIINRKITKGST